MAELNIVLVEPEIPQNTGNISRTCAVTGARLHLVKPMGFTPTDKQLKRAGLDYWEFLSITYYEGLDDFFAKTSGHYYYFTTKAKYNYSDISYKDNVYLLFGKETAGLPEELLIKHPERCVRIPMLGPCRSLNLSNAAAIGLYEVLRQWDFPELKCSGALQKYNWEEI